MTALICSAYTSVESLKSISSMDSDFSVYYFNRWCCSYLKSCSHFANLEPLESNLTLTLCFMNFHRLDQYEQSKIMSKVVMVKNLGLIQKYFKMAKVDTDITCIGVLSNLFRPSLYQVVPLISILRL